MGSEGRPLILIQVVGEDSGADPDPSAFGYITYTRRRMVLRAKITDTEAVTSIEAVATVPTCQCF